MRRDSRAGQHQGDDGHVCEQQLSHTWLDRGQVQNVKKIGTRSRNDEKFVSHATVATKTRRSNRDLAKAFVSPCLRGQASRSDEYARLMEPAILPAVSIARGSSSASSRASSSRLRRAKTWTRAFRGGRGSSGSLTSSGIDRLDRDREVFGRRQPAELETSVLIAARRSDVASRRPLVAVAGEDDDPIVLHHVAAAVGDEPGDVRNLVRQLDLDVARRPRPA